MTESKDLAQGVEKLEAERDALAAELKALREQMPVATLRNSPGHIGGLHFDNHAPDILEAGMKLYARPVPAESAIENPTEALDRTQPPEAGG